MGLSQIVLDTHIWFWYINGDGDRYPLEWQKQIQDADIVAVSAISCYEIVLAQSKGKLMIELPITQWFHDALEPAGIKLLPLTPEVSIRAVNLSPIHKDPFDRLIIATALEYNAKLASLDQVFPNYPELQYSLMP